MLAISFMLLNLLGHAASFHLDSIGKHHTQKMINMFLRRMAIFDVASDRDREREREILTLSCRPDIFSLEPGFKH